MKNMFYSDLGQKNPALLTEEYYPLWLYSSGITYSNVIGYAGNCAMLKGTSATTGSFSNTASKIHTLNSSWLPTQQFAFEASIYAANASYTVYAALYDVTAGAVVSSSQISTTSTISILLRSSKFTLISGHTYGVALITSNTSYYAYISKAHLIAFMS